MSTDFARIASLSRRRMYPAHVCVLIYRTFLFCSSAPPPSAAGLDKKDVRRNEDKYEPGRCAVCFETQQSLGDSSSSSSAEDCNMIVTCCKCLVPVHQWCYGVPHSAVATPVRVGVSDSGAIV
jgi:hypothetical protein